ncbi:MAG TPA: efflux RND transporter periplasmic adaptor subunit [candidate division Zixibacteria bacterium]|nr:efflux RND transporter periplasmic adaptor subunit [candidate division Zixibacteria bacterium]
MKKRTKWFLIGAGGGIVALLIIVNLLTSGEKATKVQTDKVKKSDLTAFVTANGKIEPKTKVKISAYVAAKITGLPVKEGDKVRRGQLLVQLDPLNYQASMDQVQASLQSSQARLNLAKANLEQSELVFKRQKQLFEKNLTSQEQFDAARTQYNVYQAEHDAAVHSVSQNKAALDQAKDNLDKTTITTPINGVVTDLNAEVGEIVLVGTMNNPGTVIMTVSDLSEIEAEIEVDETDIANVKIGQEAKFRIDAFPDTTFKGKVTEIGNTGKVEGLGTQNQVTSFKVKVQLVDNVPTVRPGMSCSVDIITNTRSAVLNLPIQAVVLREPKIEKADKKDPKDKSGAIASTTNVSSGSADKDKKKEIEGVFVVKDGRALFLPVRTGIADQQNIEIISGIQDKDEVITGSYRILRTLKDGEKIKIDNSSKLKTEKEKS